MRFMYTGWQAHAFDAQGHQIIGSWSSGPALRLFWALVHVAHMPPVGSGPGSGAVGIKTDLLFEPARISKLAAKPFHEAFS